VLGTLNVMMAEAVRRELIPSNPCANVKKLKNDRKKIEILTVQEVQKLFPKNYETVWGDKEIPYAANRLASLTGMRIGEIMGLRGEYVFDDYIYVCGQYTEFGYGVTKNKENRYIPLLPEMIELLRKLMEKNGKGYVFSQDGGGTPVGRDYISNGLERALQRIGITEAEIKRRGLTMHSWRHFLNTEMLQQGLTVEQVQGVTGHKSKRMTDRYNHPDARKISDITKAQAAIAGKEAEKPKGKAPKKEAKKTTGHAEFKIAKSRGEGNADSRKKAS
jgi:integrase